MGNGNGFPVWALVIVGLVSALLAGAVTAWALKKNGRRVGTVTKSQGNRKRPPRLISRSTEAVNDMLLDVFVSVRDKMGLRSVIKQNDATRLGWISSDTTPTTTARSSDRSPHSQRFHEAKDLYALDVEAGKEVTPKTSVVPVIDPAKGVQSVSSSGKSTSENEMLEMMCSESDRTITELVNAPEHKMLHSQCSEPCASSAQAPIYSLELASETSRKTEEEIQQVEPDGLCENLQGNGSFVQVNLERDVTMGSMIGSGGISSVYSGVHQGCPVAVKVLHESERGSETSFSAFCSEVRVLQKLQHPNIISFYGARLHPPPVCIVEELADGGSLHDVLHISKQKPEYGTFLQIALEVAHAMCYCHQLLPPVVHRDLKTQNILLTSNGHVKIADFGIAKFKQSTFLDTKHLNAGTVAYMAPELFTGELIDEKIDVYSFGVILWECWTGQMPWLEADTPMHIVAMVGMHKKRLKIPDDMPRSLATLIRSCWKFDPRQRPTFVEIAQVLEKIQAKHSAGIPLSP